MIIPAVLSEIIGDQELGQGIGVVGEQEMQLGSRVVSLFDIDIGEIAMEAGITAEFAERSGGDGLGPFEDGIDEVEAEIGGFGVGLGYVGWEEGKELEFGGWKDIPL
uniref:Uncharacterized protein n=1 Tax=Panagrellus redivivus TaxID=6233 RepID=A0A7E4VGD0_PANRE